MSLSPPHPPRCPITGSGDVSLVAEIGQDDLRRIWRWDLGIDILPYIGESGTYRLWYAADSDLQFFEPAVFGDQRFYDQLRGKSWYSQPEKWEFWEAAKWVPPAADILEIGAGTGTFQHYVPESNYTSVDLFPADGNTQTRVAQNEQFHVVVAFQVLEHTSDPVAFAEDALSYLKPGGQLFLGVPNRNSYLSLFPTFPLDLPPHHLTRWSEKSLRSLAAKCGLRVEYVRLAPLEDWEVDLFHMAKLESRILGHHKAARWHYRRPQQIGRIASHLGGRLMSRLSPAHNTVCGSTLLLRVRKQP